MKFRTLLLGLSALFVAFNAAFFSVSGLSKLFAGASLSVIIMASSLEAAKLITAGYLYNYWEKINKAFRLYLSGAVIILILITSLGIYGFLTSAFQDTFNQFNIKEKQLAFLQQKEQFWADDLARYDEELERISNNISTLSNARSSSIQVRDTSVVGGIRNTISTTELRLSQKRIEVEEENRKGVQSKREVAADSLQSIQVKILDVESMEGVSSELGPLQYLSGLLDRPMDQIINWFILIIIFVFDPLAVALVIAFNNAVKVDRGIVKKDKVIRKRELYDEIPDDEDDDINDWDNEIDDNVEDTWEDRVEEPISDESDLDIDGDGIVSDEEREADLDGDGKISKEEARIYYEKDGWRQSYEGKAYWFHPWFDWSKKERWINNRQAIDYWLNHAGGSQGQLDKLKEGYPDDFTTKTY
tara:strand:+ start:1360 stop:2607 length:1248 start_codon:yes stop_codon:yes gene_type:complete